ncbi:hypothetical protein T484DRAFT_1804761 [Baffinella frigidus]|nr:hypothetical protein T484DRAFT_1804761 [Cryptophyta sp. CCMP2293]
MHPEPPSLKAQVRKLSFKDLAQNSADSRVVPSLSFPSRVASGVSLALPSRSSGGLVSGLQSPASDHEKHATGTPLSTRVISQPIAHGGVAAKKLSTAMSLVKKSAVDKGKKRGAKSGGGTRLGEYSIYVWGRGDEFRLGTGHQRDQHLPTIVVHACCAVKAVACGSMHTLMLFAMPHGEVDP